jgi:hypothetical protein
MENEGPRLAMTGMGKMRCDSAWAALTPEQRDTLEGWLFDENLGYAEVLERAKKEFGITTSKTSLIRFYQRAAAERAQREFLDLETTVREINGMDVDWRDMGSAAMGLIAKRLLQLSLQSPDKVKEMAWLGHVLVENEAQNTRRGWLKIARSKFEYDCATACIMHKLKIDEVLDDMALTDQQQIQKVREELFGPDLPE